MTLQNSVTICTTCRLTPICKNQPQLSCPFWESKDGKTRDKAAMLTKPANPKNSFWRKLLTWTIVVLVGVGLIAAFIAGRYSAHPAFISQIPALPLPVKAGSPPDEILRRFFTAIRMHDIVTVRTLLHPTLLDDVGWEITEFDVDEMAAIQEIRVLDLTTEETARAVLSITAQHETGTGRVLLKKYQGEWRIFDFED